MPREVRSSNCLILQQQDDERELKREYFDVAYWQGRPGYSAIGGGRGGSVRIELDGNSAVLRQYHRGGLIGKMLTNQYLWMGRKMTRPWREWSILERALGAGLPVPQPISACVCRSGLCYRAAIIISYLEDTETLTQRLERDGLEAAGWHRLGLLLKRMHAEGIRHVDLNSDNILIDSRNRFSLIDFDKARIMKQVDDWQWRPLYRLQRSIEKRNRRRRLNFTEDDWQALMDGYQS
ncbi:MAG: 3-deoxy-D-manno-octulosonic acid kinase [Gammaproteobacteria bacterium]|nr:3-deoxy-D-manno-octulosonic acid kinase [Gammaproteobacteria bacterium]MDH3534655.1 3-deoxy-D-manno-octulosonic acid kinase [Gammaproteobacteria bacterium]